MRRTKHQEPESLNLGDTRTVRRFLWSTLTLPREDGVRESRKWEWGSVVQEYKEFRNLPRGIWHFEWCDVAWAPEPVKGYNPPPGSVYPEPPKPTPAAPTRLLGFPVQIIDTMTTGGFTVGVSCAFCGNTIDGDKCLRVEINNNAKRMPLCDDCFDKMKEKYGSITGV